MWATLAGTPSLSTRRKSITRNCRLWPPPWWRVVIRPCTLRPPLAGSGRSSDFSGVARVISAKSATLEPRRPGVVGLYLRIGISLHPSAHRAAEGLDPVALGELDHGPLDVLALAPAGAGALALALAVECVHGQDPHVEDLLDGDLDFGLGRVGVDQERVPVALKLAVALLRDHRSHDHVTRVGNRAHSLSPSSATEAPTRPPPVRLACAQNSSSASRVKTIASLTSTS